MTSALPSPCPPPSLFLSPNVEILHASRAEQSYSGQDIHLTVYNVNTTVIDYVWNAYLDQ